ncbi:MAG: aldo/keto reductase, partial [Nostoc sp.]
KSGGLTGMEQALGYTMSQPGVHCCVIAAETVAQLEKNVKIARAFVPLKKEELTAIAGRTANIWEDSTFFRAWT